MAWAGASGCERRSVRGDDAALVEECVESREEAEGGEGPKGAEGTSHLLLWSRPLVTMVPCGLKRGTLCFSDTTNDLLAQEI